ncbi:growth hormone-regulated TBC protein 1-A [Trichonephila inaurata madagascariensis]|uniref:Growth hormone-regulated TBC protein 1 n=1 Tax=Trichonephila inaurata madagascariensis TaxID=2747483 RepID=A0A8X6XJ51_9ARAC|nr:growth hormone-regulated TBC protein 1-A [Trichonephila inaurata madagascariensis]
MSQPPRANVDSYGFEWPKDFNHEQYDDFMSKYITVLSRRAKKWDKLLNSKEGFRKSNKVKRYVRKGIPTSQRGVVWSLISGAKELKDQQPDLYTTVLKGPLKQEIIETIDLDIPRTFPDNIYFKTESPDSKRESLKNVLLAFAHKNPLIGYCQGLNFIAGIMLLVTDSEDMTFWLLQSLVERILPDFYTKEMTGLLTDIGVLEELIKAKVPQVHERMVQTGVSWSMYVSKWFICLFAEVLPIETVLRIWDCLFYEGSKILLRVAVTLVIKNQDKILAAKNFVEITEVFKSLPLGATVTECHSFMQAIFRVPGSFPRAYITKLREYCREKVEKEKAHTKVLQEQQKQRQLEEKKAREAALELKRQEEEKEAALQAEKDKLALENKVEKLSPCDDENITTEESDIKVQTENKMKEEVEASCGNNVSAEVNQNPKAAVIASFSTESLKQVANGKQTSPLAHEESSKSTTEVSP